MIKISYNKVGSGCVREKLCAFTNVEIKGLRCL